MEFVDHSWGHRIYAAIGEALAEGELTVEELAQRVGCTPHEVVDVLVRYDRTSRVTITPGPGDGDSLLVRAAEAPRSTGTSSR